jgi:hypothetical protein
MKLLALPNWPFDPSGDPFEIPDCTILDTDAITSATNAGILITTLSNNKPTPGIIGAPSVRIVARIIAAGGALEATDLGPVITAGILLLAV